MRLLNLTRDSSGRAVSRAESTAAALFGIDFIGEELLADACGTLLVDNVCDIFVAEEVECRENRVRSCLTEGAERSEVLLYRYGRESTYRRIRRP